MDTQIEERALVIQCYMRMYKLSVMFNSMIPGANEIERDVTTMSTAEMLSEMNDTLKAVQEKLGPALQHPMIQMMMKRMG